MTRHFILTPFGSAGDVNPFLWIGRGLQARGHTVTLIVAPPFVDVARRAGLPCVTVGEPGFYERVVQDPDLWHPWRGLNLTLGLAGRATGEYFEAIRGTVERAGGDVVLVGSLLALGARLAREKFGVPLATIHLQPAVLLSLYDTPGDAGAHGMVCAAAVLAQAGVLRTAESARPGGRAGGARGLRPGRRRAAAQPDAGVDAFP